MKLQGIMDNIRYWYMADTHKGGYFVPFWGQFFCHEGFNSSNGLRHQHTGCACLSQQGSVIELTLLQNFLVRSLTFCRDRQASPYCIFILRRISIGLITSLLRKRTTVRCSSLAQVSGWITIFTLLLSHPVPSKHHENRHLYVTLKTNFTTLWELNNSRISLSRRIAADIFSTAVKPGASDRMCSNTPVARSHRFCLWLG